MEVELTEISETASLVEAAPEERKRDVVGTRIKNGKSLALTQGPRDEGHGG